MTTVLAFGGNLHQVARTHLFPGDGLEAAAILICSRYLGERQRLMVKSVISIPHAECKRARDSVTWPGDYLEAAIDRAEEERDTIVLLHSHHGGLLEFSGEDDRSDAESIRSLHAAVEVPHGSAIMVEDGRIRARLYDPWAAPRDVDLVTVAGDEIHWWWGGPHPDLPAVPFTQSMSTSLSRVSAVVIGTSGTGSVATELAARLGFGRTRLIDFDRIEHKNLNRILNATLAHAQARSLKVDVMAHAIACHRGDGVATAHPVSIASREGILAACEADVIFCCVDSLEGRNIADLIASSFLIPLFYVGVAISARRDETGATVVTDVCGRVDYVQPGGSTLADREVYTPATLRAEYLRRVAPEQYRQELEAGYFRGVNEEAPSVITLNTAAAAASVNEFLARAFPFRLDSNRNYARTTFSLAACDQDHYSEDSFPRGPNYLLGQGAREPLLGMPAFSA